MCEKTGVSQTTAIVRCCWVRGLQEKRDAPSGGIHGGVSPSKPDAEVEWNPCLHSVEGETIYDFAWQVQCEPRSRGSVV